MVQFDNQRRQIRIKVVYYGPALGGKTTSLQYIHSVVDRDRRTKLYSINTANDRTIFFDLMAVTLGRVRGHELAMQLCTVPGQVQYNATRRAVLSGVDAVVFIADARIDQRQANIDSRRNLDQNLKMNGVDPATIPVVYQLNKQDLDHLIPGEELESDLKVGDDPVFLTVATTGVEVMEAFAAVTDRVLEAVALKLGLGESPQAVRRLQESARSSLAPFMKRQRDAAPSFPVDEPSVVRTRMTDADWPLQQDDLVRQAVEANLALTDLNAGLDSLGRQLERKVDVLETVADFGSHLGAAQDPSAILADLVSSACSLMRAEGGAVLLLDNRALVPSCLHGLTRDPLLSTSSTVGVTLAFEAVEAKQPMLIARDASILEPGEFEYAVEEAGFTSAVVAPLVARDEVLGLLTLYAGGERLPFQEDDLRLAVAMASSAGLAWANVRSWLRLEDLNAELEGQVGERTVELKKSLDEVRQLNAELRDQHLLLQRAYRDLEEVDRLKHELLTRISHELRTPVTSLRSAATILERYPEMSPEESSRFVTIIKDGTRRLAEVIDGVVQASSLAASAAPPDKTEVELRALVKRALAPLKSFAETRKIAIRIQSHGGVSTIRCDLESMAAALRAMVKNAVSFSSEGATVDVSVRHETVDGRRFVRITVRDSGPGIPAEDLPRVFDAFWQGGDLMTDKPSGVGLGLTISQRVAETHGGRLDLTSRVGKGTDASLSIPDE